MFKETGCSTPGHLDHVCTVSDCAKKSEGVGATPSVALPWCKQVGALLQTRATASRLTRHVT